MKKIFFTLLATAFAANAQDLPAGVIITNQVSTNWYRSTIVPTVCHNPSCTNLHGSHRLLFGIVCTNTIVQVHNSDGSVTRTITKKSPVIVNGKKAFIVKPLDF